LAQRPCNAIAKQKGGGPGIADWPIPLRRLSAKKTEQGRFVLSTGGSVQRHAGDAAGIALGEAFGGGGKDLGAKLNSSCTENQG
jgi:hypothetical protein